MSQTCGGASSGLEDYTMVGVTTAQNTANVVPVTQFKVRRYIAIDSAKAAAEGWGAGTSEVLTEKYGVDISKVIPLGADDERSISSIEREIRKGVQGVKKPIAWILGGGQKPHQVAMWRAFTARAIDGFADLALYSDPETRKTSLVRMTKEGRLIDLPPQETRSPLTIEQIVTCFNLKIESADPLPKTISSDQASEIDRFLHAPASREVWYKLHEGTAMSIAVETVMSLEDLHKLLVAAKSVIIEAILAKLRKLDLGNLTSSEDGLKILAAAVFNAAFDPDFKGVWPNGILKPKPAKPISTFLQSDPIRNFSKYFELLVGFLVSQCLDWPRRRDRQGIVDAATNVFIVPHPCRKSPYDFGLLWGRERSTSTTKREDAQHDVLLADRTGSLTSLDAKTFKFAKMEQDARLLNLQSASGRFANFYAVFPYFPDDLEKDYVSGGLKELPVKMGEFGRKFAVVTDRPGSRWIRRADGSPRIETLDTEDKGWQECKSLEEVLRDVAR